MTSDINEYFSIMTESIMLELLQETSIISN